MNNLLISNTSLVAIVRDEKINPAGGIVDFVDCVMPFMEEGVIVDTGSLDGTRELLEEMEMKYSNLKVFDTKFDGYANARNFSLSKVQTKYAFVLDADERLSQEDFKILRRHIMENEQEGYNLNMVRVTPKGQEIKMWCHGPRIFNKNLGFEFKGYVWELLYNKNGSQVEYMFNIKEIPNIFIKHFIPSEEGQRIKSKEWYGNVKETDDLTPSQTAGFKMWKRKNPSRDNYHFGI
ncbi:MAG: glycosyltransferase [Nanoarchaeota archaeon]